MTDLFEPLTLSCGATLKNRLMLAPLTNLQSSADGVLSDDEYKWLTMRAAGGFGLTMTCAASVQPEGLGFPDVSDGVAGVRFVDAVVRSSRDNGAWISV